MNEVHRTVIVPVSVQRAAALLTAGIAGQSGAGMFPTPAGPTHAGPITHYSSSGYIKPEFADLLPLDKIEGDKFVRVSEGRPAAIVALAKSAGASVTLEQVQSMLAASICCDAEGWQETYKAAGLEQVQGSI